MIVARALLVCLGLLLPFSAGAQTPARSLRIIVPFPAGGAVDVLARVIGQRLTAAGGPAVVIENRPGTNVGADMVAKSPPDGRTLLLAVTSHAINATLLENLPFDPAADFAAISLVARAPNFLVVHPSVNATSVTAFIDYARANPGKLNGAAPGIGTLMHLAGLLFAQTVGVNVAFVPYRGTPPALNDLLSGEVQFMFDAVASIEFVRAGRLKALAVTGPTRSPTLPDVPTMLEAGYKGIDAVSWYGFLAAAATPPDVVAGLNRDINATLTAPEVRERLAGLSFEPVGTTPAAFQAFIREEIVKWGRVVRAANLKLN
jgi:tripartite-type tricarboxylate transporter receptor subunit TctC